MKLYLRSTFVAAALCAASFNAKADTYKIVNVAVENNKQVYGLDSSGAVVLQTNFGCNLDATCYITYLGDTAVSASPTPPVITTVPAGSPGPGCGALAGSVNVVFSSCNNGYELYFATPTSGPPYAALYDGPDLTSDLILGHLDPLLSSIHTNSFGDIVWDDMQNEEIIEAYNLTAHAPEPSSLFMVGTGVIGAITTLRRRRYKLA